MNRRPIRLLRSTVDMLAAPSIDVMRERVGYWWPRDSGASKIKLAAMLFAPWANWRQGSNSYLGSAPFHAWSGEHIERSGRATADSGAGLHPRALPSRATTAPNRPGCIARTGSTCCSNASLDPSSGSVRIELDGLGVVDPLAAQRTARSGGLPAFWVTYSPLPRRRPRRSTNRALSTGPLASRRGSGSVSM